MSDDAPGSGVIHTVTITIPPPQEGWSAEAWAEFKQAVKDLAEDYDGHVTEMTFEHPST